jgi:hypothetical protein
VCPVQPHYQLRRTSEVAYGQEPVDDEEEDEDDDDGDWRFVSM